MRVVVKLVFLGLWVISPSRIIAATDELPAGARADFDWFSGLGFPDLKDAPLVRVATGSWFQSAGQPRQNTYADAFLLSTNGPTFTVLDTALAQKTFSNSPAETEEYQRVGYERLNLKGRADEILDYYEHPPTDERGDARLLRRFGEQLGERTELFFLAWACWRHGLNDESRRLYAVAIKTPRANGTLESERSFRTRLEDDIGTSLIWRATLEMGETNLSRKELLGKFQTIVTNYPDFAYHARAATIASKLAKMVAQDDERAKSPPKPLEQLSTNDRIRELIYELRDENGHQFFQPGESDVLIGSSSNSAAHRLVSIGYPAVPQLIAALDDPTLSRSVGFGRDFVYSHTILTVGDCAVQILQGIAGRAFYTPKSTSSYLSADGDVNQVRADAQAWWSAFQAKGEKQVLIEAVEAGDGWQQLNRLWAGYPDAAPAAVMKGIGVAKDSWLRSSLVASLDKSDTRPVNDFLDGLLSNSPSLDARAAAATILNKRGRPAALAVMLRVWSNNCSGNLQNNPGDPGAYRVMEFLASANSPAGIDALNTGLSNRVVADRLAIVQQVGNANPSNPRSVATSNAIERLLVGELTDLAGDGASGIMNGTPINDRPVADTAALRLSQLWPAKYPFDFAGTLKTRELQRARFANLWRKENHLSELPLPEARNVSLDPGNANKIVAVNWAKDGARPDNDFLSHVNAINNRMLTARDVVDIVSTYAGDPVAGTGGIDLQVRRDEDLTGVTIALRLLPGAAPRRGQSWNSMRQSGTVGTVGVLGTYGSLFGDNAGDPKQWQGLADAVDRAVSTSADTPYFIHVILAADRQ